MHYDLIVIGGGAAGCFAAIRLMERKPEARICILEAGRKPLAKVEISGGGRCNVTHACYQPEDLVHQYPRGERELRGPFYRFQPRDMVEWLAAHGVRTKTEMDGRIFPETDSSRTIIDCFLRLLQRYGVELKISARAEALHFSTDAGWIIHLAARETLTATRLLVATGSDDRIWQMLAGLGHTIVPPVPSLFTFSIRDPALTALRGLSVPRVTLRIPSMRLYAEGPLLITHWGLSGPAVLRLSAWGAREMQQVGYRFSLVVNWGGWPASSAALAWLTGLLDDQPRKQLGNVATGLFPARLWQYLVDRSGLAQTTICAETGRKQAAAMASVLYADTYAVTGKSTFKEEFVTAGGVDLREVDFRTFQSRCVPSLYLAGEVLNIDALTGGFNFQAAWTGADIAASAIASAMDTRP